MVSLFDLFSYRFTTQTPLHIGSGEQIFPFRYRIGSQGLEVLSGISNGESVIYRLRLSEDFRREIGRKLPPILGFSRTPKTYEPFLPGSALKGVFRTAMAYWRLKQDPSLHETLSKHVLSLSHPAKMASMLENILFCGLKENPRFDLFRAILLSDGLPLSDIALDVAAFSTPDPLFMEAIPAHTPFVGTLRIHRALLSSPVARQMMGWQDTSFVEEGKTLAQALLDFSTHIINDHFLAQSSLPQEIKSFLEGLCSEAERANANGDGTTVNIPICLGRGAGWHWTTLIPSMPPNVCDHLVKIRAIPKTIPFPNDQPLFGWGMLSILTKATN